MSAGKQTIERSALSANRGRHAMSGTGRKKGAALANLTIAERLRRLGYGHRRPIVTECYDRHIVYRLDTGEEVARLFALEAAEFCREREAAHA